MKFQKSQSEPSTAAPRCLLIADDPVAAGPLVEAAARRGIDLDFVDESGAALEALSTHSFHLAAIRISVEDAEPAAIATEAALAELVREVRSRTPDLTLVGVGATGSTAERTAAGRLGVDLYVDAAAGAQAVLDVWERALSGRFQVVLLDQEDELLAQVDAAASPIGGAVALATDPDGLFDELVRQNADLLVLRHRPAGFNVLELVRALRVSSGARSLGVLVLTDRGDTEFELAAYAAGADGVLDVGASASALRARMRSLLSRRAAGRSRRSASAEARSRDATGEAMTLVTAETSAAAAEGVPSVVVVEDDPSLLEMLQYSIGNRGHRIDLHTDGREALTALLELETHGQRPVVLLDVDLPGLDGFGVLRELSRRRPGEFQVVITTVHSSEAAQVLALQTGAIDYIVKPIRMPVLLAKVQRLLEEGAGA